MESAGRIKILKVLDQPFTSGPRRSQQHPILADVHIVPARLEQGYCVTELERISRVVHPHGICPLSARELTGCDENFADGEVICNGFVWLENVEQPCCALAIYPPYEGFLAPLATLCSIKIGPPSRE